MDVLVALILVSVTGCRISSEELEFKRAEKAAQAGEHEPAFEHYSKLVERHVRTPLAIRSAKEAARIAHYHLKDYRQAISFYKHVILYAALQSDRIEAQKKIADIHFNLTLDYKQAITEYSRLLELEHSKREDFDFRFAIARSYFYLNNFFQAQVEIESILKRNFDEEWLFDAYLLKANIFLTTRKLDDAIQVLKDLMQKYPERSKAETIALVLAVCYEEQKNFAKAIETLESIKDVYPKKEFIENRIKTLRERQSYLPGARGWKK